MIDLAPLLSAGLDQRHARCIADQLGDPAAVGELLEQAAAVSSTDDLADTTWSMVAECHGVEIQTTTTETVMTTTTAPLQLWTVTEIAKQLDESPTRIRWRIDQLDILPAATKGGVRLFALAAVERIWRALQIDRRWRQDRQQRHRDRLDALAEAAGGLELGRRAVLAEHLETS